MGKYSAEKDSTATPARVPKRSWIERLFGRRSPQKQEEPRQPSIPFPEPEKSSIGWIFNRRPYHEQINLQEKTIRGISAKEFIHQQRQRAEAHKKKNPFSQFLIEFFNIDHYTQYQELSEYYQKTKEMEMRKSIQEALSNVRKQINRLLNSGDLKEKIESLNIEINRNLGSTMEINIRDNPQDLLPAINLLFDFLHAYWNCQDFNYYEKSQNSISLIGAYTNAVKSNIELIKNNFEQIDEATLNTLLIPINEARKKLFKSIYVIYEIPEMDQFGSKLDNISRRNLLANKFSKPEENIEENPQTGERLMEAIRSYEITVTEVVGSYRHLSSSSCSSSSSHPVDPSAPLFQAPSPQTFSSSSFLSSSSNPPNAVFVFNLREGVPEEPCQAFGEWAKDSAAWLDLLSELPPLNAPNRMTYEALLKKNLRIAQLRYHPDKNPQNVEAAEIAFKWILKVYEKALLEGKSEEDCKEWYRNYMAELAELRRGWAEIAKGQEGIAKGQEGIAKGQEGIAKGQEEIAKGQEEIAKGLGKISIEQDEIRQEHCEMHEKCNQIDQKHIEMRKTLDQLDRTQTKEAEKMEKSVDDKTEKADGMLRGMGKLADEMLTRIERRIERSAIHSLFFQRNEKEQKILRQQRRLSAPASLLDLERRSKGKGF